MCFPWKPMENTRKTLVFHWNLWKTIGKHKFPWEPMDNTRKLWFSVGTYGKHWRTCGTYFHGLEPLSKIFKTILLDLDLDENGTKVKQY